MDSFYDLIEGVRLFEERFGIRTFIESYVQLTRMQDRSQTISTLMIDYNTPDPVLKRSRTFILACIGGRP